MTLRLFIREPEAVFEARVNQTTFEFPIAELTFDGVTTGAYTDILPDLTVLIGTTQGADNLGRTRARIGSTSSVIKIGRSSIGTHDGEVSPQDDAYITVLNDRRIWAKIGDIVEIEEGGEVSATIYKDHDIVVGTYTTTPPPVANAGVPAAGTIDDITGVLRVKLPHETNSSFAVTEGATITDYLWTLPTGVTLVGGYALSDSQIEVDCDPGFYYVGLTVTDSEGSTHTAWTWIFARDPDDDATTSSFEIESHTRTQEGQTLDLKITTQINESTFPDGTLVAVMDGEPSTSADRSNLIFWGWHDDDPARIDTHPEAVLTETRFNCYDVAGRLAALPGFPLVLENEDIRNAEEFAAITWVHMVDLTLDMLFHYILAWHSTALEVTDYVWANTGTDFVIGGAIESEGASLWEQLQRKAHSYTPGHMMTCDRWGRLYTPVDPLLQDSADRTATVQQALDSGDYSNISWTHQRFPRTHWLRGNAIKAVSPLPVDSEGEIYQPTLFCIAPGDAPGQGENEDTSGERLAVDQEALNSAVGHEYARINAPESQFRIELVGSQFLNINPALMQWVTLTIPASIQAERTLSFTAERGLPIRIEYGYPTDKYATYRTATLYWERETEGDAAVTVNIPEIPEPEGIDDDFTVPWTPPLPTDPDTWYPPVKAYVMWDQANVVRTWDVSAVSPAWEVIAAETTDFSGDILDGQYFHASATIVGMWLLTTAGVYLTLNVMADDPVWSEVFTLADAKADGDPGDLYAYVMQAMANYGSEPGYLIVAAGPTNSAAFNYPHSWTWHTHDYGVSWTAVDMDDYLETAFSNTSGYWTRATNSLDIHKSSPTIFMVASTSVLQDDTAVFVSEDGGHTWDKRFYIADYSGDENDGPGILAPFPSIDSTSYMIRGNPLGGVGGFGKIYYSNDAWETATGPIIPDAKYRGTYFNVRPNTDPFVDAHVILINNLLADGHGIVCVSTDKGVTYDVEYDTGYLATHYATPNGWPPDSDIWFIVQSGGGWTEPTLIMTEDNWSTVMDKTGDLETVLDPLNWDNGENNNGFALPKVGPNA